MGTVIPVDFRLKKRAPQGRQPTFSSTGLAPPLSISQVMAIYAPLLALWGLCLPLLAERSRT
jgi:hypothetical protein